MLRRRYPSLSRLSVIGALIVMALALVAGIAQAQDTLSALPGGYVTEFVAPNVSKLAVGRDGSLWGTDEFGERIIRISSNGLVTGRYQLPHGSERPDEPAEAAYPQDIALGGDGNMWFTEGRPNDEGKALIGHVSPTGQLKEIVVPGAQGTVRGIAAGTDGEMWFTGRSYDPVAEETKPYIGTVDSKEAITEYPLPIGAGRNESLPGWSDPAAITLGPDGNMWFLDDGHNVENHPLYGSITPTGAVTEHPLTRLIQIPGGESAYFNSMALGPDNAIWFPSGRESVARVTAAGEVTEVPVTGVGNSYWESPGDIVGGPDGNVWFVYGGSSLGRITPSGAVTIFTQAAKEYISTIALGAEGELWYPGGTEIMDRLKPPLAPVLETAPAISGSAVAGSLLTVGTGGWANEPTTPAYQWELCDSAGSQCEALVGATGNTSTLTGSEIGRTLRATVTATNLGGSATATSPPSAVVQAPASAVLASQTVSPPSASPPPPEVAATMTWKFGWASRFTLVESLIARGLPSSGEVEVRCHGSGCPFSRKHLPVAGAKPSKKCRPRRCRHKALTRHVGEIDLTGLLRGRHLSPRTRLDVSVVRSGWIGKLFRFAVRETGPPRVDIGCLAIGSHEAASEC